MVRNSEHSTVVEMKFDLSNLAIRLFNVIWCRSRWCVHTVVRNLRFCTFTCSLLVICVCTPQNYLFGRSVSAPRIAIRALFVSGLCGPPCAICVLTLLCAICVFACSHAHRVPLATTVPTKTILSSALNSPAQLQEGRGREGQGEASNQVHASNRPGNSYVV